MRRLLSALLALAFALWTPPPLLAWSGSDEPKAEVFTGYSAYRAGGKVNNVVVPDFQKGWAAQFIINTTRRVGIVVGTSGHYNDFATGHDFAVGLRFQTPVWRFRPFAEGLTGVQHFSPKGLTSQNTATYVGGAGIDVRINPTLSVRPFQFSYVHTYYASQQNYFDGTRVQAGLIYNLGVPSYEGLALAVCNAAPSVVDPGTSVNINVSSKGFLPKHTLSYSYVSTAGTVTENHDSASVDTSGVQPGNYTVTARVVDNGKRKHQQSARCQTEFSIKAKLPPVLALSAERSSVMTGETATITAKGSSPNDRPLSYSCSASNGRLKGTGSSYALDTAGAPRGEITIKCTVTDDRKLTASATTSVSVTVPESKSIEASKFGTVEFKRDLKRPARVDNQAKGELDRYADALATSPETKSVVVGYAAVAENKNGNLAAQRAVNTKDYLVRDKGIDPARIESRTGSGSTQNVDLWITPAGATLAEHTTAVDEGNVKAVPRVPLKPRSHRKLQKQAHKTVRLSCQNRRIAGRQCGAARKSVRLLK